MDILIVEVEFLIPLRRITINMLIVKYFGLLEHVCFYQKRFLLIWEDLIKPFLHTWKKLTFVGEHLTAVIVFTICPPLRSIMKEQQQLK